MKNKILLAMSISLVIIGIICSIISFHSPDKIIVKHNKPIDTASVNLKKMELEAKQFDLHIDNIAIEGNCIADSLYDISKQAINAYHHRHFKLYSRLMVRANKLKHDLDVNQSVLHLMISQRSKWEDN